MIKPMGRPRSWAQRTPMPHVVPSPPDSATPGTALVLGLVGYAGDPGQVRGSEVRCDGDPGRLRSRGVGWVGNPAWVHVCEDGWVRNPALVHDRGHVWVGTPAWV